MRKFIAVYPSELRQYIKSIYSALFALMIFTSFYMSGWKALFGSLLLIVFLFLLYTILIAINTFAGETYQSRREKQIDRVKAISGKLKTIFFKS